MADIDLQQKFPDMRPIKSAPSLTTVNGFGFRLYGARDHDEVTQTHVATYCLCALYVPILALRAYRVARDGPRYFFLGRVPLSGLARFCNLLVVGAVLCLGGVGAWKAYTSTPGYVAGRKMVEADRAAEAADFVEAAKLYFDVAAGQTSRAPQAAEKIQGLLDRSDRMASLEDASLIWEIAVELQQQNRWPAEAAKLVDQAVDVVGQHAEADPRGALAVLDSVTPLVEDAERLLPLRQQLLERIVAREPDDPQAASLLAAVYEAQGDLPKCEPLLVPHVDRLGDTEGARILGQIWARQGKFEESHALLLPYCEKRLERLHAAEEDYENAVSQAQQRVLGELNSGEAEGFDYETAQNASEAEQDAMVQEYVHSRLRDDPGIRKAQEAMLRCAAVVPVALDLGMVILRRAQDQADPAVRRTELEKAEKTFLAVRGLAGETDEYRLNLAQVYYWLGKHDEGRKLFDELLESRNRSYEILMGVSQLLRQVGAVSEARVLVEEAYNNEQDQANKYAAAMGRAVLFVDLDDEITWFRRADPTNPRVQAELNTALGEKAVADGQPQKAVEHLRKAIDLYGRLTENEAVLNNSALAYITLYRITGDREELQEAVARMEKAVSLRPDNSILLSNLASYTLEGALREIIGDSVDLTGLKMIAEFRLLEHLYRDESGKNEYVRRVRSSPGVAKALSYLEQVLLLAPKRAETYATVASIHGYTRNLDALSQLSRRAEEVDLDLADSNQEILDYYSGEKDEKLQKEHEARIGEYEDAVTATRKDRNVTFAVAATRVVGARMSAAMRGQPVEMDELVRLAEEAHDAAPSSATASALTVALLFRAHETLVKDEPAYAQTASKVGRALDPTYLVAVAVSQGGAPAETALKNPDVRRALDLVVESANSFPDERNPWDWAVLQSAQPEIAAQIAETVRQDKLLAVQRALRLRLSPLSVRDAFNAHWAYRIAGNEEEAAEVLQQCGARGLPLPFDLK